MATAQKTYTFTGSAEGWNWTTVSGAPSSTGYGTNRLEFASEVGRNKTSDGYFSITGTFASIFGIGTGDIVTGYSAASFSGGCTIFSTGDYYYEGDINASAGSLVINDGTSRQLIANQSAYTGTGQTHTPSVNPGISGLSLAGSTNITLYLYIAAKNNNDGAAQVGGYVDDISISIEYSVPTTTTTTTVGAVELTKNLSDTVYFSDNRTSVSEFVKGLSDNVYFSDEHSSQKSVNKALADTVYFSDSNSEVASFVRSLSDTVYLSDERTKVADFNRTLTDTVYFADQISNDYAVVTEYLVTSSGYYVTYNGYLIKKKV